MLNLIQHLIKSRTYETLKRPMKQVQDMVQGDKSGLFTKPSNMEIMNFKHLALILIRVLMSFLHLLELSR